MAQPNQKYYPDLGKDMSTGYNFCAVSSVYRKTSGGIGKCIWPIFSGEVINNFVIPEC